MEAALEGVDVLVLVHLDADAVGQLGDRLFQAPSKSGDGPQPVFERLVFVGVHAGALVGAFDQLPHLRFVEAVVQQRIIHSLTCARASFTLAERSRCAARRSTSSSASSVSRAHFSKTASSPPRSPRRPRQHRGAPPAHQR